MIKRLHPDIPLNAFILRYERITRLSRIRYHFAMTAEKVTGPASYFPSIEKKYGKPIEHWMNELKKVSKFAHMEQVAHLKEKFEMGQLRYGPQERR
jgi:hypothetical protein